MWALADDFEDIVPPPRNIIEDVSAIESDAEDDWDLQYIPTSGTIDLWSSLRGFFYYSRKMAFVQLESSP